PESYARSVMSGAGELIRILDGRWLGTYGVTRCPAHDDHNPSLGISQADDGRVLVRCHRGCPQDAVIAALERRGLWGPRCGVGRLQIELNIVGLKQKSKGRGVFMPH